MRVLVDLFACQTSSRFRGIGRYTNSLINEMAQQAGNNTLITLANSLYPESFEELRQTFTRLLPKGNFKPYDQGIAASYSDGINEDIAISEVLVQQAYNAIMPNVILTPSIFEGWGERGVVPLPNDQISHIKNVAVLYDLIPLIFKSNYLDPNPLFKTWYLQRLESLKRFDLLFAISESTRRDAIDLLGIPSEKVINISGAVNSAFHKINLTDAEKYKVMTRYGITKPFVLYLGGNNFRKNMDGALLAYSNLPREILDRFQLVLNDVGEREEFELRKKTLGLLKNDVIVTGHISENDLVALYNMCEVFIFPSIYEGFGLPVLEAMSCGAAVLCANNSSLPEIMGRADAMFNASDTTSITSTLNLALTNKSFTDELRIHSLNQSKLFSWENTSKIVWKSIEALNTNSQSNSYPSLHTKARIAFVSPLPPQKSGISDYSAELLPYLSKYFQIDLFVDPDVKVNDHFIEKNLSVFRWTQLLERQHLYKTVIYQFGNSSFHFHMMGLLEKFPGVVVLHDFYLSNMLAYTMDSFEDGTKIFERELDYSHGVRALVENQLQETADTCRDWPANLSILKFAVKLIVHSEFHFSLLKKYYGINFDIQPNMIKLLRKVGKNISDKTRQEIRKTLRISKDEFLFCSFGMLTPGKMMLSIIQAFGQVVKNNPRKSRLIFVGEICNEPFRDEIHKLLETLELADVIEITGYTDSETYEKYLIVADVAIQIRTRTRGETSRAVLDCMSYSKPTIINDHGTFQDYSQEDVIKIPDQFSLNDLINAMVMCLTNDKFLAEKGMRARNYVNSYHDPEIIAKAYTDVINQAICLDERSFFAPLFDAVDKKRWGEPQVKSLAKSATRNFNLKNPGRVLIDVSHICIQDYRSGIQRVVKKICLEFLRHSNRSINIELVRNKEGRLYRASRFIETLSGIPSGGLCDEIEITERVGDILLMLDSSWFNIDEFLPIFERIRFNGGVIFSVVYDLIPVLYPQYVDETMEKGYTHWLNTVIMQSDRLISISHTVADEIITYIDKNNIVLSRTLDISYFHLGADIQPSQNEAYLRNEVNNFVNFIQYPYLLMVGTLEPRKGHAFVLDAFDNLWNNGVNIQLCFMGKVGWKVEQLKDRILNHPELGKRFHFFENPSDAEIEMVYGKSNAIIMASHCEGFGLPIVEASLHNKPVLVSDIPVFHEIAGDGALYFSLTSPESLSNLVLKFIYLEEGDGKLKLPKINTLTWGESSAWLTDILSGKRIYKVLKGL